MRTTTIDLSRVMMCAFIHKLICNEIDGVYCECEYLENEEKYEVIIYDKNRQWTFGFKAQRSLIESYDINDFVKLVKRINYRVEMEKVAQNE